MVFILKPVLVFVVVMILKLCEGSLYPGIGRQGEEIVLPPEVLKNTSVIYKDDNGALHGAILSKLRIALSKAPLDLYRKVRFHLWTKQTPADLVSERLWANETRILKASTFNPAHPTKFLIHGYYNTIKSPAIQAPKEAYLLRGDYNIIGVDWGDLARSGWYPIVANNTIAVGNYVGEMITFLKVKGKAKLKNIHLIGHSLGAHVAGIAGGSLGRLKVARITDFPWTDLDIISLSCSHSKAYKLWAASILQKNPEVLSCSSCVSLQEVNSKACSANGIGVMGEDANHTTRGILYLETE